MPDAATKTKTEEVEVHVHFSFGDKHEDYIAPIPEDGLPDPSHIKSHLPVDLLEKLEEVDSAHADVPADSMESTHVILTPARSYPRGRRRPVSPPEPEEEG